MPLRFQDGAYHRRKWFAVRRHASFHTAVTPTTEDASPFTIFDDEPPEQSDAARRRPRRASSGAFLGARRAEISTARVEAFAQVQ